MKIPSKSGKTGLIYNSIDEFEEKLVKLMKCLYDINLPEMLMIMLQTRLLSAYYKDRSDWYYEMVNNLPKLNEELKLRAPELF